MVIFSNSHCRIKPVRTADLLCTRLDPQSSKVLVTTKGNRPYVVFDGAPCHMTVGKIYEIKLRLKTTRLGAEGRGRGRCSVTGHGRSRLTQNIRGDKIIEVCPSTWELRDLKERPNSMIVVERIMKCILSPSSMTVTMVCLKDISILMRKINLDRVREEPLAVDVGPSRLQAMDEMAPTGCSFLLTDIARISDVDFSIVADGRRTIHTKTIEDRRHLTKTLSWCLRHYAKVRIFVSYRGDFRELARDVDFTRFLKEHDVPVIFNFSAQHFRDEIVFVNDQGINVRGCWVSTHMDEGVNEVDLRCMKLRRDQVDKNKVKSIIGRSSYEEPMSNLDMGFPNQMSFEDHSRRLRKTVDAVMVQALSSDSVSRLMVFGSSRST